MCCMMQSFRVCSWLLLLTAILTGKGEIGGLCYYIFGLTVLTRDVNVLYLQSYRAAAVYCEQPPSFWR